MVTPAGGTFLLDERLEQVTLSMPKTLLLQTGPFPPATMAPSWERGKITGTFARYIYNENRRRQNARRGGARRITERHATIAADTSVLGAGPASCPVWRALSSRPCLRRQPGLHPCFLPGFRIRSAVCAHAPSLDPSVVVCCSREQACGKVGTEPSRSIPAT